MCKSLFTTTALALCLATSVGAQPRVAFDVAEDHTRIFMAAEPVHENGMPAHGNAFVSQGYIYPEGTLADGVVGVLEDGTPAFPDLVLGIWTCNGYFVGEGGNATSGVWIISRQTFAFDNGATVVTQGTELADIGRPNLRPITGATGEYASFDGGLIQTTLGFTDYWGLSATYTFENHTTDTKSPQNVTFGNTKNGGPSVNYADHLEWDSGVPVGPIDIKRAIPKP